MGFLSSTRPAPARLFGTAARSMRQLPFRAIDAVTRYTRQGYDEVDQHTAEATSEHPAESYELNDKHIDESLPGKPPDYSRTATRSGQKGRGRLQWYTLFLCSLMYIMWEFGEFMSAAPQGEIFLRIACRAYYARTGDGSFVDTAGEKCRIEPVQAELALVDGWKETFDQFPGIILAIPYGILADRIGRKPIMLLAVGGVFMSEVSLRLICWYDNIFPLRLVWAASLWRFVGGGNQVQNAMVFTALADTHDEKDRADAFYKLLSAIMISQIVATPLSAGLMTKSPWIPMMLTPAILFVVVIIALFLLPETLQEAFNKPQGSNALNGSTSHARPGIGVMNLGNVASSARSEMRHLLKRRNVVYLLFCFFSASVGRKCMVLLLQFVYKKFGWTFAQASLLMSLLGAVNLANNLAILPVLTRLVMSARFGLRLDVPHKDLAFSKALALLLTLSCLTLAACASVATLLLGVALFALGSSFFLVARSLVTSLVPPTHVGVLYTAIGMVSGVGVLISGPLLAHAYTAGMKIGDAWLGMPYAVAAGLFSLVVVAAWRVELPGGGGGAVAAEVARDEEETDAMLGHGES